jgi:hypothetical protein
VFFLITQGKKVIFSNHFDSFYPKRKEQETFKMMVADSTVILSIKGTLSDGACFLSFKAENIS